MGFVGETHECNVQFCNIFHTVALYITKTCVQAIWSNEKLDLILMKSEE